MSNPFIEKLKGVDLRSIGESNAVVQQVTSQHTFDQLIACLCDEDRRVVMRCLDAVEKVTRSYPEYLTPHKQIVLNRLHQKNEKEVAWHLALLVPRLKWTHTELGKVWNVLAHWALNRKESRIVRVNALQGLYELLPQCPALEDDFQQMIQEISRENIPSLTARIKKLV